MSRLDDALDLLPCELLVEPHADPAARSHVRWHEIAVGVGLDEHRLHAVGRGAPKGEPAVAVMIVREMQELLLADEPAYRDSAAR